MKKFQKAFIALLSVLLMAPAGYAAQDWLKIDSSYTVTAGEVVSTGNAVYIGSDGLAYLADSDVFSEINVAGIVQETGSTTNRIGIVIDGITNGLTSLTPGGTMYLSATAGAVTQTVPVLNPVPVGIALSATEYRVNTDRSAELQGYTLSFADNNLVTNQAAVASPVAGSSTVNEIEMPWAGSVTAVSIVTNESRTAGSIIVDVTKNGSVTGLQATLNNTDADHASATQTILRDTFAAGDRIGVKHTTTTDWAPVTADFSIGIMIQSGGN